MVPHVPLTISAIRLYAQMRVNALRIRPLRTIKKRSQQLRRRELLVVRYELFRQLNTASHILLTIVRFPHIVLIHPDRTAPITPSQSPMPTALEVPHAITTLTLTTTTTTVRTTITQTTQTIRIPLSAPLSLSVEL